MDNVSRPLVDHPLACHAVPGRQLDRTVAHRDNETQKNRCSGSAPRELRSTTSGAEFQSISRSSNTITTATVVGWTNSLGVHCLHSSEAAVALFRDPKY